MPRTIDLNADLGEGCPDDRELLARVTSASVCCGAHAGDPSTIRQTLRRARERGVVVGAHPGYPDREGFGRRDQFRPEGEIRDLVQGQVRDLEVLAAEEGVPIRFLKPHGALYNQAQADPAVAGPVLEAIRGRGWPILGLPGGEVERLAPAFGVEFIAEGFADRRYRPDGRLVPRSEPGSVLDDPDEIRAQVRALADRGVRTLCLHGDDPRSVALADFVLATLANSGIGLRGLA